MKTILIIMAVFFTAVSYSQTFKVEKVNGTVKAQTGTEEKWTDVKAGSNVNAKTTLVTAGNSSVQLAGGNIKFTLKEFSAVNLANLKKIDVDELLLALALDNVINAPKRKEDNKAKSTAVYGTKEGTKSLLVKTDDFGIKKLNGAVQLAESGFKESAVVAARETFRKYPETSTIPAFRIYFAGILSDVGLYEEAHEDFTSIKKLNLNDNEKKQVESELAEINKKLSSK